MIDTWCLSSKDIHFFNFLRFCIFLFKKILNKFTYLLRKINFHSTSVYVSVCSSRAEIKQSQGMRCVGGALAQVTGDAVTKTETGGAPTTRYNDLFIIQHSTSKEVLCLLHKYCKWKYVFSTKWKHCSRKYSSKKRKENYPYVSMKNIFLKQSDGWASTVATIFFHILFCDFLDCISDIG